MLVQQENPGGYTRIEFESSRSAFGHVAMQKVDPPGCAEVAFMGRKEQQHAQEWSGRYLEFSGKAFKILPLTPNLFCPVYYPGSDKNK